MDVAYKLLGRCFLLLLLLKRERCETPTSLQRFICLLLMTPLCWIPASPADCGQMRNHRALRVRGHEFWNCNDMNQDNVHTNYEQENPCRGNQG